MDLCGRLDWLLVSWWGLWAREVNGKDRTKATMFAIMSFGNERCVLGKWINCRRLVYNVVCQGRRRRESSRRKKYRLDWLFGVCLLPFRFITFQQQPLIRWLSIHYVHNNRARENRGPSTNRPRVKRSRYQWNAAVLQDKTSAANSSLALWWLSNGLLIWCNICCAS